MGLKQSRSRIESFQSWRGAQNFAAGSEGDFLLEKTEWRNHQSIQKHGERTDVKHTEKASKIPESGLRSH